MLDASALVYAAVAGVVSWAIYKLVMEPLMSPLQKIPGLPFRPIIGNLSTIFKGEAMESTLKLIKKYGGMYRYHFFLGAPRISVTDPELLKYMMVTKIKNYEKAPVTIGFVRRVLGRGLVFNNGSEHAAHRRLISPSFNKASVNAMSKVFDDCAVEMVEHWSRDIATNKDSEGWAEIKVATFVPRYTLEVIGKTAFGYNFHSMENPDCKAAETFHRILTGREIGLNIFLRELVPFGLGLRFSKDAQQLAKDLDYIEDTIQRMIANKRKEMERNEEASPDILSIMMRARDENGCGMTDDELNSEVRTLLFAGHETTAAMLLWTLYALCNHTEIQDKLRQEVLQHWPKDSNVVTSDVAENMPYLAAVVKETLRLYPAAPILLRQSAKDDVIRGYKIPAGTRLVLNVGAMMRLPEYYPDPDKFKPERFMDQPADDKQPNPYHFMPFGIGSRMCIGYKFAALQIKMALSHLIKNFRFEHVPGREYKRKSNITMKPNPELILRVSRV